MEVNIDKHTIVTRKGKDFKLRDYPTTTGLKHPGEEKLKVILQKDIEQISAMQYKLFAENRQSLLIVLQGMDGAGKDSTIKNIMSGLNPQGVVVHSFKAPAGPELLHDFLYRYYTKLPENGRINIFNRSHYENVLISRVHPEIVLSEHIHGINKIKDVDKAFWEHRYERINAFEDLVTSNGTRILKFFLHLSKKEQGNRFLERIDKKEKHWKFSVSDIKERVYWDEYQDAYEKMLKHTGTKAVPWYIIPADDKWYSHLLIGKIIVQQLADMNPVLPPINREEEELMKKAKEELLKEMA